MRENAVRTEEPVPAVLSNAEIADRLAGLAQLMAAGKENPYKIKAYQRAAARIRTFAESIPDLVREDADLTAFPGIGNAIAAVIREIVTTGTLGKLERLRAGASPELTGISHYPRLDPKRVLRVYKELGIASVEDLKEIQRKARRRRDREGFRSAPGAANPAGD